MIKTQKIPQPTPNFPKGSSLDMGISIVGEVGIELVNVPKNNKISFGKLLPGK